MIIYTIENDIHNYQYILPENEEDAARMFLISPNRSPKSIGWVPPKVLLVSQGLKRGDFFQSTPGAFIVSERAAHILDRFLTEAGEKLPIICEEEVFTLLNVTREHNSIDRALSELHNSRLVKLVFKYPLDLSPGLFKTGGKSDLLVLVDPNHPETDFVRTVRENDLQGLIFTKVWSSEDE